MTGAVERIGATKVTEAVVACVFPIPRHLCVANVAWSLLPYEADLLAMTKAGYLIEVEVKVSLADLRRDARKTKWKHPRLTERVSRFYYAMPRSLWEKPGAAECVREGAGVIVVCPGRRGLTAEIVVEATRTAARPLDRHEQFDLARVGSYRAWSPQQRHRQRQLIAEHMLEERRRGLRWERYAQEHNAQAKGTT